MATHNMPLNSDAFNEAAFVKHLEKKPVPATIVPLKFGIFGGTGTGKSTTAALMALWLSKTYHNSAPVYVTDTEMGWQFLAPLFEIEGVPLVQKTTPTFKAMCENIVEAERAGACVWIVDSLTLIWQELLKAARGNRSFIPIDQWGSIKATWNEYTTLFLNSRMHCFALGRLQNDMEEIIDEQSKDDGKTKLVKVGTKFKAGGGESFGYEPHCLLEMSTERKPKRVRGQEREGEGRTIHRADVLKDRTWALNGKLFRWSDKSSYDPGGFSAVAKSLQPHFLAVQRTSKRVSLQPGSSEMLFDSEGNGEFYRLRQRKEQMLGEIKAVLDLYFAGRGREEVQLRIAVNEAIFGVMSKEAIEALSLEKLERGLRILQAFHKYPDKTDKNAVEKIALAIHEYDSGEAELQELPF